MRAEGITVNELIKQLQELKEQGHGDAEVIVGGTDYPEGASGAWVEEETHCPYHPKGSVGIS